MTNEHKDNHEPQNHPINIQIDRVYGSTPNHIGRPKVEIAAENIYRVAPDARCEAIQSTLNLVNTAKRLATCDIVFGCTDDNAGRLVLSRLPTYLLTPVIDCGVLVSSDESGMLVGIDGRITIIDAGSACLLCRGRIDVNGLPIASHNFFKRWQVSSPARRFMPWCMYHSSTRSSSRRASCFGGCHSGACVIFDLIHAS